MFLFIILFSELIRRAVEEGCLLRIESRSEGEARYLGGCWLVRIWRSRLVPPGVRPQSPSTWCLASIPIITLTSLCWWGKADARLRLRKEFRGIYMFKSGSYRSWQSSTTHTLRTCCPEAAFTGAASTALHASISQISDANSIQPEKVYVE